MTRTKCFRCGGTGEVEASASDMFDRAVTEAVLAVEPGTEFIAHLMGSNRATLPSYENGMVASCQQVPLEGPMAEDGSRPYIDLTLPIGLLRIAPASATAVMAALAGYVAGRWRARLADPAAPRVPKRPAPPFAYETIPFESPWPGCPDCRGSGQATCFTSRGPCWCNVLPALKGKNG